MRLHYISIEWKSLANVLAYKSWNSLAKVEVLSAKTKSGTLYLFSFSWNSLGWKSLAYPRMFFGFGDFLALSVLSGALLNSVR